MKLKLITLLNLCALLAAGSAVAQTEAIEVKNAWVRAAVPGQSATGAFMTIIHKNGGVLVRGSSPVAGVTEIHQMKMEGDVMKMRDMAQGLNLPAGRAVELAPGGNHLMLMDLKGGLLKDSMVPVTLWFKDAGGVESKLELKLPVALSAPKASAGMNQ